MNETGNSGGNTPGNDNKIDSAIHDFTERISELFRQGNRRRLEVKNPEGRTLFGLPLLIAAVIGLFLLWRVPVLLIVAVVVALVMKFQFVIVEESEANPTVEPDGE